MKEALKTLQDTRTFLSFAFLLSFTVDLSAQDILSVNHSTGTASITIPLYTIGIGDLSSPVALSYTASGLKVEDYDNTKGMGWRLIAEGKVYREVKGFPDEVQYQGHASYSTIYGWLRSSVPHSATVQTFSISNDNNPATCTDETTDATALNTFGDVYDTEPDVFTVSAPGLSCSFVFDATASHIIKTIPYKDYKIEYALSGNLISSFTITNEQGIKYFFTKASPVNHYIDGIIPSQGNQDVDPATLELYKREFLMYRKKMIGGGGGMTYNAEWALTKMEDTKGNQILFDYQDWNTANASIYKRWYTDDAEILIPNGSGGFTKKNLFTRVFARPEARLLGMRTIGIATDAIPSQNEITFEWAGNTVNTDGQLKSISHYREKERIELVYSRKFIGPNSVWNKYGRYFLLGVQRFGNMCDKPMEEFKFTYYDVDDVNNTCYCVPTNGSGQKIDTIVNIQDYYGYYNGAVNNTNLNPTLYVYPSLSNVETYKINTIPGQTTITIAGSDRSVNNNAVKGSLKRITMPAGGVIELEYDNNDFFDADVNGIVKGGGIRVTKITRNDGFNTNEITTFNYNNPSTSLSSGKITSVPKFAVAFPNTNSYPTMEDRVKNSTYLSTKNLSAEPAIVYYSWVTVSKQGAGKMVYEFDNSGGYRDADLTYWKENMNYVARTNLSGGCTAISPVFLKPAKLQYPFSPNPNYDFERGTLKKITTKTEFNAETGTETYTYTPSHTSPTIIYGLAIDYIGNNMKAYSKYAVNAVYDKFIATKVSRTYHSTNPANGYSEKTESYTYTPAASSDPFRVLLESSTQNSDGITYISRFKYAKQYTSTSPTGDDMTKALDHFKNTNNNKLIETSQSKVEAGVEKWLGGSVKTYKTFAIGYGSLLNKVLPWQEFSFVNSTGASSFAFSTVSSNTFVKDNSNYINTPVEITSYNTNASVLQTADITRRPNTYLTSVEFGWKIGDFINAKIENIIYDNFDVRADNSFLQNTGSPVITPGHASTACVNLQPAQSLYRLVYKPALPGFVTVSFWAKDVTANTIAGISLTGTASIPPGPTFQIPLATSSTWKYYELKIPARLFGVLGQTSRYVHITTNTAFKIDDVTLIPPMCSYTTLSYTNTVELPQKQTAVLSNNGRKAAYEFDVFRRISLVKDQFDNIVESKKYHHVNQQHKQPVSGNIYFPIANKVVNTPVTFITSYSPQNQLTCTEPQGVTYTWNFGDGTGNFTTQTNTLAHTYTTTGKYQVTVTIQIPGFSNLVVQTPATGSVNPVPVEIVTAGTPPPASGGTPVICAYGILQYTGAGQCILSTQPCAGIGGNCSETHFVLTGITGGNMAAVKQVDWEQSGYPVTSWGTIYTTTNVNYIFIHPFHIIHTGSYTMRAKITFLDNSIAYSNSIAVINGD